MSTLLDRALPHRIKKYAESQTFVDIDSMVEYLQNHYRKDYSRKKRKPFRKWVSDVYEGLIEHGDITPPQMKKQESKHNDEGDASENSDNDENYEYEDMNMMNQSVSSLYNGTNNSSKKLLPSRTPQSFEQCVIESNSTPKPQSDYGWYLDRNPSSNTQLLKPVLNESGEAALSKDQDLSVLKWTPEISRAKNVQSLQISHQNNLPLKKNRTSPNLPNDTRRLQNSLPKTREKISKADSDMKQAKKRKIKEKFKDEDEEFLPGRMKFTLQHPETTFADVAGNNESLHELARLLVHVNHPEIFNALGVSPPRGVLLHGPPGCGKTLLGNAIAGELKLPLLRLVGPELVAGVSGESERRVRDVFETAIENSPCILFLDEIDAIAQRRENSTKDMERRIVAQLLSCLDDLNKDSKQVIVIGSTNRPDTLDPALRRAGRFDREICLGIPDEKARKQILAVLCKDLKLEDEINYDLISRLTPGYVGADLMSLCREAAMHAVSRILNMNDTNQASNLPNSSNLLELLRNTEPFTEERLKELSIVTKDFERAVLDVQPSAKREGFATVPDVTWDDIGALENIREELSIAILGPVRNPEAFAALGLMRASGVLLAGPPGCGKTLLAKAIANESGINFVSVKGPELLNMYVGESERAVRQCFERARNSAPCVIFFDELDSLCPRRSSIEAGASARVVNQMLTELDGLQSRKQVFVVAATNRPDIIDPAVLRPGRLDKTLYIGIPTPDDRVKILSTITKSGTKPPLSADVCLQDLAKDERCKGFTGADLSSLVREASLNAIRANIKHNWQVLLPEEEKLTAKVTLEHFNKAFMKVRPSISPSDQAMYEDMRKKLEG